MAVWSPTVRQKSHQDHANAIPKALRYGLDVFSCQEVADKYKGVKVLLTKRKYKIGGFTVQPIKVAHNVECYAYLIEHEEIGRLLFATDLVMFPYKIRSLNHIMIEMNYSEDIMIDRLVKNDILRSQSQNHSEMYDTIDAIRNNYNSNLQNVILIHLSDSLSDEEIFKHTVRNEIGIIPYIAKKDLTIEINKEVF